MIVSGGGTGGHIYPALALIEELKKRGIAKNNEILYVGTKKGLESRIVPDQGIHFTTIKVQGFKRSLSLENFKTISEFIQSVQRSKKIVKKFKPDVVIGTGGYVSGAVVFAAARLHIPTIVHEQNSVAGVTNKFLSHFANKVAIAFPSVADEFPHKKVVMTGNPRAQQVAGMKPNDRLSEFGLDATIPTLLIFGGSRGAEKINQAFVEAAPAFSKRTYQVLFASGQVHYDAIQKQLADVQLGKNVVAVPYIQDMPEILPDVAAIVGRAGATSLAEITALGIPSILIPSPYVTHNHQVKNAQSLVDVGAAKMITEDKLDGASLLAAADELMSDADARQQMATAAKQLGVPDASDQLIAVMQELTD
ncbi:undecaprenyldiphospho-muramoylpentapeptide beta-N- acetylglucosaminyltransferase [Lactobacillus selangorensis]|uniref:UDP-N-acetylglucosamine--N-acetylmuramyl-(pentapeptide) pyrophosphoryl-undecaprenol N-acetylglucosamine transferase n=1 Tax=Lactobacillus selangorensis TaxID=81857 RepID=A0A0R2GBE6_9LACO|nr:undecaprenyldiphospho-muramoylpentapeptide beta-N- acetylglucosaminyltransferase [Lactobacillus selangorensis]KRN34109.1 undecaprenyldiphospho-muramoylpentapeptide beta-N- acetylglucosaminyltransferase [Lactobacillus selangorensis]